MSDMSDKITTKYKVSAKIEYYTIGGNRVVTFPDPEGEFVRYDDIKKIVKEAIQKWEEEKRI